VSPQADTDEIRFAYHRKIKQCHPDKVAGLAPEFVDLAERHTRTLNAAYYEATRARDESAAC
jgi:curved DNA-binding protein CbpA